MSSPGEAALPPTVVACLPTFNAAEFIEETLSSLLDQTYANLRILISDDCSSDDTVGICRRTAGSDKRVEIFAQSTNRGWIDNVNSLLSRARGDYILIAGHDDTLNPAYVERLVEILEQEPGTVLAFSDTVVAYPDGKIDRRRYYHLDGVNTPAMRGLKLLLQIGIWWIPYRGVFRSSVLAECPGLQRNCAGEFSADWPWLLGLALRGRFVRVPTVLCHKRFRTRSVSRGWKFNMRSWVAVDKACLEVINRSPLPAPQKLFLYLVTALAVPRQALGLAVSGMRKSGMWK